MSLSSSANVSGSPMQSLKSSHLTREILGVLAGASVFVAGLVLDPLLSLIFTARSIGGEIDTSFGFASLTLVVVGLCILTVSTTVILTRKSSGDTNENIPSSFDALREVFSKRVYSRLLVMSAVVYAAFYSFASGLIVYNPNVSFSTVYHISVPSSAVATCCSPIGQTPLAVFYLTEHLGLLLVPVNLLLLFSISWLVGLNVVVGAFLASHRATAQGIGWLGGIGAFAGLFTSCPTCAGLLILSILGGTSTVSAGFFLGPLQTLFVGISIPMLIASPLVLARSLRRDMVGSCPI